MGGTEGERRFIKDKDILDSDFGELVIKKETVQKFAHKFRGNARIALGRICTKEDFVKKKKAILNQTLP
jgi:hypothetical protein